MRGIFKIVGGSGGLGEDGKAKGGLAMAEMFPRALRGSCTVSENHHCIGGSRVPVTFSPAQTDLFTCLRHHGVTSLEARLLNLDLDGSV